ncbi:hypothetical protein QH494_17720 [Sphingomonas sp. AR_OL41]|jgi:hypothetical protein|uniref:hypothetical protein n=1 Tax=Sphingomonas sp. AR_OL41 TaxID=3042729 RepID=UPI0024803083|nr:hypothetical protein [Sphingomonas sp. AR_OL41]MDH7974030.1 hypothetical protein [Sphingomonas sp. AR_OL41]
MRFDPSAFAVGTLIARREKVTGAAATTAGMLMGIAGMTPTGVVLLQSSVRSARRRQRASETDKAAGTPQPTPGTSATPTPSASGTPPPTPGASGTPPPTPSASGSPPPTPEPTPTPTPVPVGITADDLKAGLADGFAQFGKQMEAQNAKLLAAITSLAAKIETQNAAIAGTKKSG